MLPTINLDPATVCAAAYNFSEGRRAFIGHSFAYYLDKLLGVARQQRKSLDRILTETVLDGMAAHPRKTQALFWFCGTNDLVILTVCDLRQKLRPMWMRNAPGYMECGSDYVHLTAKPFLYWDGNNLTRVYPMPEPRRTGQTYLCDLGSLMGYYVGVGDEGAVDCVASADPGYAVYSIVPEAAEEIVTIAQRRCVLLHAFYTSEGPPEPDDMEDESAD